jgi:hypothetical protein
MIDQDVDRLVNKKSRSFWPQSDGSMVISIYPSKWLKRCDSSLKLGFSAFKQTLSPTTSIRRPEDSDCEIVGVSTALVRLSPKRESFHTSHLGQPHLIIPAQLSHSSTSLGMRW